MRTLIFSDTHLTPMFEFARFTALEKLIRSVDRVIINGDFWDGFVCSFSEFVSSEWSRLFPLLLKKHTVYLYGNHDPKKFADTRIGLFSVQQGLDLKQRVGQYQLDICHGDLFLHKPSIFHIGALFSTPSPNVRSIYRALCRLRDSNIWPVANLYRFYLHQAGCYGGRVLHQHALQHLKQYQLLVCGHSHLQRDAKEGHYLNTGRFEFGSAEYGLIIDDTIQLVREEY